MKTHPAIIFLLMTVSCYADPQAGKTATITVSYTGSAKKSLDVTAAGLTSPTTPDYNASLILPLYISDARHWAARVEFQYDKDGKRTNRMNFSISDLPAHGDAPASPEVIFTGLFDFESGKPVTVLKTPDYSITVTLTLPDEKK